MLHQLITDYQKFWPARFDVPPDKVKSLLFSGLMNHGFGRIRRYLSSSYQTKADRWVHNRFSRNLARFIPEDTQYFIGLSSFCLEALEACGVKGIKSAVDHGSLHQIEEARFTYDEARRWGQVMPNGLSQNWIIEKENAEFSASDHVFVLSNVARDSMMRCGVPAKKIIVNPCGVNLAQFYPGNKMDEVFRVIQVGAVSLGKGILTSLAAFAQANLRDAEFWFVGGGYQTSGLHSVISAMRTPGVIFHQPVDQARLREYYNQSTVFILASVADGFGMVVLQAMACGLPVIVTENVGAKDLIVDGVNGFIVPVGAPQIIAERLRQLHGDPELCRTMGMAARQTVEKGYAWQDYGDRLVSFLRSQVPA